MKASNKVYEEVANYCSAYSPSQKAEYATNSTNAKIIASCTNCRHFTDGHYCDINLYDKIVKEKNLAEVKEQ